ncbi:MAG: TorF family putative porin [Opitutaceae bacterium]|jgi:uncharacterized protein (TIGR02001 family)|nr:TorF family putative porin [Opitutaceae bacterium]
MKKIAILISMLAGLAGLTASAQQTASTYKVTADFSYTSQYVFRGLKSASDAFTPSVELAVDDFHVGLWTMQPISTWQGIKPDNEIDIYAVYKQKVTSTISVEGGATYYWYPDAQPEKTNSTSKSYELGVGATWEYNQLNATAYYYYDFRLESNTLVGSVGYKFPIAKLGTSVDVVFYIGTVGSRDWKPDALRTGQKNSYNYYGFDVSVPYHINDRAIVTAGVHYANNDNTTIDTTDNRFWFTVGLTFGF